MKIAVVSMVKDSTALLPEFILHYSKLMDKIYLIDHNSKYDLSKITHPSLRVIRSDQYNYFQEECTNLLIDSLDIKDSFDWLFVLDIDEFLPFFSKNEIVKHLQLHSNCSVISYPWKNGLIVDSPSDSQLNGLVDSKKILFYSKVSSVRKCAVNIKKTKGNFFIPRSSHHVAYYNKPLWHRLLRGAGTKFYLAYYSSIFLCHIVSTGKKDFENKIKNFKEMRKMMDGVRGNGGNLIYSYPDEYSFDELLRYVANYRVGKPEHHIEVCPDDFEVSFNFSHIDKKLARHLRSQILNNPCSSLNTSTKIENEYLLKKKEKNIFHQNQKWFYLSKNQVVLMRNQM